MLKTQFWADDQRKLGVRFTGGNGYRADDGGQAPGLDDVVHKNYSAKTDFNNAYFDYEPRNAFGLRYTGRKSDPRIRSYEPPFAADDQRTVAGDKFYVQPPSYSAFQRATENSTKQFIAGNGYRSPVQFHVQPPSYSAFQHGTGNSAKQFTDGNGYRALVQAHDGGLISDQFHIKPPSYSAFQHGTGNSAKQFTDGNGHRATVHAHDGGPAPDLDAILHDNSSAKTTDFNDYLYYGRSALNSFECFRYAFNPEDYFKGDSPEGEIRPQGV